MAKCQNLQHGAKISKCGFLNIIRIQIQTPQQLKNLLYSNHSFGSFEKDKFLHPHFQKQPFDYYECPHHQKRTDHRKSQLKLKSHEHEENFNFIE